MKKMYPLLAAISLLCSCGNLVSQLGDSKKVTDILTQDFHFKDITVSINNGTTMDVAIINSAYNDSTDDARQRMTDTIAQACLPYFLNKDFAKGTVTFENKSGFAGASVATKNTYTMRFATPQHN